MAENDITPAPVAASPASVGEVIDVVGSVSIRALTPLGYGNPCGPDCRYACLVSSESWDAWLRCTHIAVGGVVREGGNCPWFIASGDLHTASERDALSDASLPSPR